MTQLPALQDTVPDVIDLLVGIQPGDALDTVRRNAHEMKSVSGSIGLYGVMNASEMLEILSTNGDEDGIGMCIMDLGDALAEIREAA